MSIVKLNITFVKKQKSTRERPTQRQGATFIYNNNSFIDFILDMKISVPKQSIQWQMKQSKIKVK